MELSNEQIDLLILLMRNSAHKGNLANSGLVIENGQTIASSESLVVSNTDATAHSERMLVEAVCKQKQSNYTPGLTMVTVCEPCLMCISACSWAGYQRIAYIIPADKYLAKIPWMSETRNLDKKTLAQSFANPIEIIHKDKYENIFSKVFEEEMAPILNNI